MNWTIMRKNLHIPKHNTTIHKTTSKADTIQDGFTSPLLPHEVGSKAQSSSLHGSSLKPKYNIFFSIKAWGPLSIQNGLQELQNLLKEPLGSFKLIGLEGYAQASSRRNGKAIQPTKREKRSNQMLGSFLTN